jgi:hypothetical protein
VSRAEFGNLGSGNDSRQSMAGTYGCGWVVRTLQEAAAVLILAGQTAGRELERKRILDLADLGAARMAGGHNALVVEGLCARPLHLVAAGARHA